MKTHDQASFAEPLGDGLYSAVVLSNGSRLPVPGYERTTEEIALRAAREYLNYMLRPGKRCDRDQIEEGQATEPTAPVEPSPSPEPIVPEIPAPNVPQPRQPPPIDPMLPEPID